MIHQRVFSGCRFDTFRTSGIQLSDKSVCVVGSSPRMAVNILEAYEGTLEEDFPPVSERYEHSEMLLYKVLEASSSSLFRMKDFKELEVVTLLSPRPYSLMATLALL